tara:strand:- start:12689 stop:13732 length:1044 start_codon:yes stop_codon:yes gene_type:complete
MENKNNLDLTVVVPFYKRDNFALKILKAIDIENKELSLKIEVIYVDSYSSDLLENILSNYIKESDLKYRVIHTDNYVGVKRNCGIKSSNSEYIICMDDDCIPGKDFLKNHFNKLTNSKVNKVIYSGMVMFPDHLCETSNYYRFRNFRHRVYDNIYLTNETMDFHNIITMNMSFKKSDLINENLFFDNDYTTYGLEDTQFGLDAMKKNFLLKTCLAPVIHQESTSIDLFILKIRNFAQNYFFRFYQKNDAYLINRINSSINKHSIISHISLVRIARSHAYMKYNYPIIINLLRIIPIFLMPFSFILKTLLKISDKKRVLYFVWMYKALIIITIISTLFDAKLKTKNFI